MFTQAEHYAQRKVRLWTLPLGVPLCALIQILALGLDCLHRDKKDTEQFLLLARKPAA
jgi:hypothetical protein